MLRAIRRAASVTALVLALTGGTAAAQTARGILTVHLWDSPPNLSRLEGTNPLAARSLMPVFNNLVIFDQHVKQSRLDAIVPEPIGGAHHDYDAAAEMLAEYIDQELGEIEHDSGSALRRERRAKFRGMGVYA